MRTIVCPSSFTIELTFLSAKNILKTDLKSILLHDSLFFLSVCSYRLGRLKYNEKTASSVNMTFHKFCLLVNNNFSMV